MSIHTETLGMSKLTNHTVIDKAEALLPAELNSNKGTGLTKNNFFKTIWLFTASDLLTSVLPVTAFGILGALAGPLLTNNSSPSFMSIISRLPAVLMWNYLNVFTEVLSNQCSALSVSEDIANKPWRPLPAGLISVNQARWLMVATIPTVLLTNYLLGAWEETALLMPLIWMYNDLSAGNDSLVLRNLILSVAFGLHNLGGLRIAAGAGTEVNKTGYLWAAITSTVILATMHVQDLKDVKGDKIRGRKTIPLVLGEGFARWSIAIPVIMAAVACPMFWNLKAGGYLMPVGLGAAVAGRVLVKNGQKEDEKTWKMWTAWLALLFCLPIFKDHSAVSSLL